MKVLLLTIFFIGIILTIVGYYTSKSEGKPQKVIYKFIDPDLEESQKGDQISLVSLYKPMFEDGNILQ